MNKNMNAGPGKAGNPKSLPAKEAKTSNKPPFKPMGGQLGSKMPAGATKRLGIKSPKKVTGN